jgi:hypothetical protein
MAEIIVAPGLFQRRCSNKAPLLLAHKSTFFAVATLTLVLQLLKVTCIRTTLSKKYEICTIGSLKYLLFLKGNNVAISKEADMANLSFL